MKVLIIDGVGPFGGASRSLYESMRAMPPGVERHFVVQKGTANALYREHAKDMIILPGITRFDNSRASHYEGARWLILLREFAYLPFTLYGLLKAKLKWKKVDLIHCNEVMEIFAGVLAKIIFDAPLIVHVRSLIWDNDNAVRIRFLRWVMKRYVDHVIAIDENNLVRIKADVKSSIIHNCFDPEKMPTDYSESTAAYSYAIPKSAFVVGYVGNVHLAKGIFELLRAVDIAVSTGYNVHCLVIGSSPRKDSGPFWRLLDKFGLAQEQESTFLDAVDQMGMQKHFHFTGHTSNIAPHIRRMNVLAFPSYFDACGRPVFEAAFYGVPSIAAVSDPRPDTLDHGVTGLAIPRPDPALLADAIIKMINEPAATAEMGKKARELATRNFTPSVNAAKLYTLYAATIAARRDSQEGLVHS
jgi:glycosyltransferase involved in cell wall biosynthesis